MHFIFFGVLLDIKLLSDEEQTVICDCNESFLIGHQLCQFFVGVFYGINGLTRVNS